MGLAVGMALKIGTSLAKRLNLETRRFWGPIPTFVEVTGENLVAGVFFHPRPILNWVKETSAWKKWNSSFESFFCCCKNFAEKFRSASFGDWFISIRNRRVARIKQPCYFFISNLILITSLFQISSYQIYSKAIEWMNSFFKVQTFAASNQLTSV